MWRRASLLAALAAGLSSVAVAADDRYTEMRDDAVKRCTAIDPSEYRSGLLFNPEGYRSLYVRSACFQDAAVHFRDAALCAHVKQRRSLFSSSWGYSRRRCGELVEEGEAADREALLEKKARYESGAVTLRDFTIERNGNGRDYDIIPVFDPGAAATYVLRFEIIAAPSTTGSVLLDASGFHLEGNDAIRIFVRRADIVRRFASFEVGRSYPVRATLTLDVGNGGQGGWWRDDFIERVFPSSARTVTLVREARF